MVLKQKQYDRGRTFYPNQRRIDSLDRNSLDQGLRMPGIRQNLTIRFLGRVFDIACRTKSLLRFSVAELRAKGADDGYPVLNNVLR